MPEITERAVSFFSDGVTVRGHLTAPAGASRLPAVVLSHGFMCVMAMGLPELAHRLAGAGYAVLRIDYRGFGESDGEPRNVVLPLRQSDDVRAALSFLGAQPEADPERLALWGTSFGGAIVLHAGALDERARAVIASVPVTNGLRWIRGVNTDESWARVEAALAADRERRALTGESEVVSVADFRPPKPDPGRDRFFAMFSDYAPARELPWSSVDAVLDFRPDELAGLIAPRALLLIGTPSDGIVPYELAERAYALAREPKRLVRLPDDVTHFDVYWEPSLSTVVDETLAWLGAHLG